MIRVARMVSAAATIGAGMAAWRADDVLMRRTKPWIVPSLQLTLVQRPRGVRRRLALLASTTAATAGDCLLMKEHRLSGAEADDAFRRGVAAFALQQIGYSALMWSRGARPNPEVAMPLTAVLVGATSVARRKEPGLWPVLAGYGMLLVTTGVLSYDLARRDRSPGLAVGGLLFNLSDALIVARRMMIDDPRLDRAADAAVLLTYGAAQSLLVDGLADG